MKETNNDITENIHTRNHCIACGELIRPDAKLCPHCRSPQSLDRWKMLGTILKWVGGTTAIISLVIGVIQVNRLFQNWRDRQESVYELVMAAEMQGDTGDYAGAWKFYEQALELEPGSRIARTGQVRLAMRWLRNIEVGRGKSYTDVVIKLLPVLYRGAAAAKGVQSADLFAHIGWANYLRYLEGMRGVDVDEQFKYALKIDPDNVYAHAMQGIWIVRKHRGELNEVNISEANIHFSAALKTGQEREYVRRVQLSTYYTYDPICAVELIRVVDQMRKNHEAIELSKRKEILQIVYLYYLKEMMNRVPSILPPADHLATFLWLTEGIGDSGCPVCLKLFLARLTEEIGDLPKALSLYRSLRSDSELETSGLKKEVDRGIARTSRGHR